MLSLAALSLVLAGLVPGPGFRWLENRGQWDPEFAYGSWVGETWVGVARDAIVLQAIGQADSQRVALRFEGASPDVAVEGLGLEPGVHHRYHGTDPEKWIRNVHGYRQVRMAGVHPGIDVVLRTQDEEVVLDVYLMPDADIRKLRIRVTGSRSLHCDQGRGLLLETSLGRVRVPRAMVWRRVQGDWLGTLAEPEIVSESTFALLDTGRAPPSGATSLGATGTAVAPELLWSTYWGTNDDDVAEDAALDVLGDVTIVGTVDGGDYLLSPGVFHTSYDDFSGDVFVAKFHQETGDLVYSARIGSTGDDSGQGVAVDASGRATVVGWAAANGKGFPTTPAAFDPVKTNPGNDTAFVLRLSPGGDQLEYSTYLEGTQSSKAYAVDVAPSGSAVVVGVAGTNFPTTAGSFSPGYNLGGDTTITRLDPTGSFLEWSTYLGGSGPESPERVVLDSQDAVYVVGYTGSVQFPATSGAFQTVWHQKEDGYVAHLSAGGDALIWATYLGGSDKDVPTGIALLPGGDVIVAGVTESSDFPTTPGAFQETYVDDEDAFVSRLDATGSSLVYSTLMGGTSDDLTLAVAVDASGVVTATGKGSTAFPTTPGAFQTTIGSDAFLALLHPDGSRLFYSTGVGGTWLDQARGLAVRPDGLVTIAGYLAGISSPAGGGFPVTPNALVPGPLGGQSEAFITTLWPLLQGVKLAGTSSASCLGPVYANATTMPLAGQPFGLYCTQAPPDADGYLITFTGEFMPSIQPVKAGPEGFLETDLGNLPNTPGKLRRYRYAFRNTPTCPGQGPFSYSNLVVVQVQ